MATSFKNNSPKFSKRNGKPSGVIGKTQRAYWYVTNNGDKQNISEKTYLLMKGNPYAPKVYSRTINHINPRLL